MPWHISKSSAVACDNFLLRASQASRGAVLIHRTQFLVKNKTDRKAQNNELKLPIVSFCLTIEFSIIIGVLRSVFYCLNAAKITAVHSQPAISAYLPVYSPYSQMFAPHQALSSSIQLLSTLSLVSATPEELYTSS